MKLYKFNVGFLSKNFSLIITVLHSYSLKEFFSLI